MAKKVLLYNRNGDKPLLPLNDSDRIIYSPLSRTVEDILTELLNRKSGVSTEDLTEINNQIEEITNIINGSEGFAALRMSVKATYTVGGVKKGTVYTNELVTKIVKDILSPYVPPILTVTGGKVLTLGKTYNIPVSVSVKQGSNDISSVKIDNVDSQLVNDKVSKTFNFDPAQTTKTVTVTANDGKETVTASTTFNVYEGLHIIFSALETAPTTLDAIANTCFEVGNNPKGIYTVENKFEGGAYPYFYISNRGSVIKEIVANRIGVPFKHVGSYTIAHNGAVGQYEIYRGTQRANKGTITYYINPD